MEENNTNDIMSKLKEKNLKVVAVTKHNYTLENGDVYEHTFDIDDDITVEEFQKMLDNAKTFMVDMLGKINEEK